ncbi:PIN domain-containing protein [Foetidibacter luteolus]|uniref:PIN domain-containing protein n=1 Tax=Foetidibacter luteolus TaxID=2608880 RepID=UPI00129BE696|nr:PIN domain-containing protein [Foetidibacter luteolus]
MTVIIDSNIIFSALLNKNSRIVKQLFKPGFEYTSVNYVIYEIFNHKERLLSYSKLKDEEQKEHFELIFAHIRLVPQSDISFRSYYLAHRLIAETDMDDIAFVALAFELNAPLWTNDLPVRKAIEKYNGIRLFKPFEE